MVRERFARQDAELIITLAAVIVAPAVATTGSHHQPPRSIPSKLAFFTTTVLPLPTMAMMIARRDGEVAADNRDAERVVHAASYDVAIVRKSFKQPAQRFCWPAATTRRQRRPRRSAPGREAVVTAHCALTGTAGPTRSCPSSDTPGSQGDVVRESRLNGVTAPSPLHVGQAARHAQQRS